MLLSLRSADAAASAASATAAAEAAAEAQRPRLRIGFFSELYHTYLTRLIYARPDALSMATLPRLPEEDDAEVLRVRFERLFEIWRASATGSGQATRRAALALLWPRFQFISFWLIVSLASDGAMPFLIFEVVHQLRTGTGSVGTQLGIIFSLGALTAVNTGSLQQVLWNGSRCGMRAKIALSAAVYRKMLRIDLGAAASAWSSAEISNVVALDIQRLELAATFGHFVWSTPLALVMCSVLAAVSIGVSASAGILFLVALFALQRSLGWRIARLRKRVVVATDARVKLMQDVLLGSSVLKVNSTTLLCTTTLLLYYTTVLLH